MEMTENRTGTGRAQNPNGPGPPGAEHMRTGCGDLGSTGTSHAGGGGQAEPLCR